MKTKQSIRRLTVAALGTALVCVCTRAIQIPIPLGYAHLGDFAILLFAVYFGPWVGALAAGIGSALADLLGYPEWTLATFIIKCLMGWAVAVLARKQGETASLRSFRVFLAALYVNLTNQCSCACIFCLRQSMDRMGESGSLWLEREPTAQEVIAEFDKWNLPDFREIVFCGFGEPTCALPVLLEVAGWLKENGAPSIRLNTNGQGSLIAGRDISGELAACVDTVSISLNHPNPKQYQALVRSRFGDDAFPAMLDFAKRCAEEGIHVIMTTVDTTITHEEEDRCRAICQEIGAEYRIRPWAE